MTNLKTYQPRTISPSAARAELAHRAINIGSREDRGYLIGTSSMGKESSKDAWLNYGRIGEVRYAISRSARIAGYTHLQAEYLSQDGSKVNEVRDRGVVAEEVEKMYGKFGGVRGMCDRFYTLMQLTAETYPIWVRENDIVDGLWFLSPSEIDNSSIDTGKVDTTKPIKWITGRYQSGDQFQNFTRLVQQQDFMGRVWVPSGQYTDEVDSPMHGLNPLCEMLHTLTESIMGRLRQRFALAGILLIPAEMSDAAINVDMSQIQALYSSDKVMNYLITIMTRNVVEHSQGRAQMPALLKGPADVLDKVKHILLDTTIADTDIKLRAELINRLLDGLNQQKQASKGGEDSNHWSMWAVSDEERRIAVQPEMEMMCHALTRMVLWPALVERGWEPGRIRRWRVGFDLSQSAVKTNVAEDARQAYDRGIVGADFVRRSIGATDHDKMSTEEYVRWYGANNGDAVLATYGLAGVEVAALPVRASEPNPGPNPDSPGDDAPVGPGVGQPGSPDSRDSDAPKSEEPS